MTEKAIGLYALEGFDLRPVPGHEGGRNRVYICSLHGEKKYVLRLSALGDRTREEYLAETEFIRYLVQNGAPVADVKPSVHGNLVESYEQDGITVFVSLFEYAKGMLLSDNGYRYREGAPRWRSTSTTPARLWARFTGFRNSTTPFIAAGHSRTDTLRNI